MATTPDSASARPRTLFPAHPAGLQTLFFTEMWERFSYYGMRALLVLFMVDQIQNGGLELTDPVATAIYGLYTAAVYLLALPGGWIADRLLGAQRAIWFGGIVIMLGHFTLAIPSVYAFFLGLLLVASGTGLLKPNISAIVADLYPEGGARRDAGFTIFYMGINVGAAIGPLVCSTLGEAVNWHYGFAAAGVGMVLGLILSFGEGLALYGGELWSLINPMSLLGLLGVCMVTGSLLTVAGAIYPAFVAARMEPVDAMRSEV